jgi:uncharacterized protein (DUF697 family)
MPPATRNAVTPYKEELKRICGGQLDDASELEKERAAHALAQSCGAAAGLIAMQPVPLIDPLLIAPIQIAMVQGIARIYGYRLDKKSVLEILRTLRMSLLTQSTAGAAAKLVPVFGSLVSGATAHALTYAIGELSIRYFRGGRSMLPAQMRATLRRLFKEKRELIYRRKLP